LSGVLDQLEDAMKRIALATAFAALAVPATAAITVEVGPGNIWGDEIVLLDNAGLLDSGPLVQGITNQSGLIVDFYGAGEDLILPSGGQARLEAMDGALSALTISYHDPLLRFTSVIINPDAADIGSIEFFADGSSLGSFDLDDTGQNFFRVVASGGDSFDELSFVTSVDVVDLKQPRVGAVPEPATLGVLALGALGLFKARRRR
jgi:hypothetical protein